MLELCAFAQLEKGGVEIFQHVGSPGHCGIIHDTFNMGFSWLVNWTGRLDTLTTKDPGFDSS
jgi:hypothetical protein